jgi:hypothetical protein
VTGGAAACFTCNLGKTHCSFNDGEVKVIRKRVKKPKQDVKMAEVSEGLVVDVEMTEVGQSKGTGKQDLEIVRSETTHTEVDVEMAEPEVGTIARPDKGKGRATPAIIVEPPTPVKGLTDLADIGSTRLNGKHHN